jgi:hypothetical protein
MTLDDFLTITETRIPKVEEMASLCDTLGIAFGIKEGVPCLSVTPDNKAEGMALAKLFKREPFRSLVIGMKLGEVAVLPSSEKVCDDEDKPTIDVPDSAIIVISDRDGYTGVNMKGESYMWTWIGAKTWFYVRDYPIPVFEKSC